MVEFEDSFDYTNVPANAKMGAGIDKKLMRIMEEKAVNAAKDRALKILSDIQLKESEKIILRIRKEPREGGEFGIRFTVTQCPEHLSEQIASAFKPSTE